MRYIFHELRVPLQAAFMAVEQLTDASAQLSPNQNSLLALAISQARGWLWHAVSPLAQLNTVVQIINDTLFISRLEVKSRQPRPLTRAGRSA